MPEGWIKAYLVKLRSFMQAEILNELRIAKTALETLAGADARMRLEHEALRASLDRLHDEQEKLRATVERLNAEHEDLRATLSRLDQFTETARKTEEGLLSLALLQEKEQQPEADDAVLSSDFADAGGEDVRPIF